METPSIQTEKLLTAQQRGTAIRLFARVTVQPGEELAFHTHRGDAEAYYILSGTGLYTDGTAERTVAANDVTFCPDGGSHGIRCVGTEPLVFLALIY